MLQITKIFRFEMAHAIYGYPGKCNNLHGHSYELHVTIGSNKRSEEFIPAPGFIMDFKELKKIVQEEVISKLDHNMVLSESFVSDNAFVSTAQNICLWEHEPTAENILMFIKNELQKKFPSGVQLARLKLYETADSYAEWINDNLLVNCHHVF